MSLLRLDIMTLFACRRLPKAVDLTCKSTTSSLQVHANTTVCDLAPVQDILALPQIKRKTSKPAS
jgi:hypothetical protein